MVSFPISPGWEEVEHNRDAEIITGNTFHPGLIMIINNSQSDAQLLKGPISGAMPTVIRLWAAEQDYYLFSI
jgi:hypothetical protein